MPRVDPREFKTADELNTQGVERIRSALKTLDGKASPEEACVTTLRS